MIGLGRETAPYQSKMLFIKPQYRSRFLLVITKNKLKVKISIRSLISYGGYFSRQQVRKLMSALWARYSSIVYKEKVALIYTSDTNRVVSINSDESNKKEHIIGLPGPYLHFTTGNTIKSKNSMCKADSVVAI